MKTVLEKLREFHAKHGFVLDQPLPSVPAEDAYKTWLRDTADELIEMSKEVETGCYGDGPFDPRLLRAHLMIEELGEVLSGLAERDEVATLDGLTDLLYVLAGTAVGFDLPLAEGFNEVHSSNMTKAQNGSVRLRDKGPSYRPPNLDGVLKRYRERQSYPKRFTQFWSERLPGVMTKVNDENAFKWLQLVMQELWMWSLIGEPVNTQELHLMCERRGFSADQRRFIVEGLTFIGLWKE